MRSRRSVTSSSDMARIPMQASEGGLRADPGLVRGLTCPECEGHRVTRISMRLTDGSPVDFVSCHDCEHKHWRGTEGALALDGILDRARKLR
jgi:DNA-directed RNA polymerase subunit M/transcription elongation factor TFIIS